MNQVDAYAGDVVVNDVGGIPTPPALPHADAAGSLGVNAGALGVGAAAPAGSGFPAMQDIPMLEAPVLEDLNSRRLLKKEFHVEREKLMAEVMNSLDFKQSMAFQSGAMTLEDVIETVQMGLRFARDKQKMQGDLVQKARLEAIQQATKDADAGILGKIFGWIGRIFAIIFLAITSVALISSGQAFVASLTIMALILTVLDFCSAISTQCGGPDISYAGLVALLMETFGASKEKADAVRQWLGLAMQMVSAIMGAVGGFSAAAKMGEMMGKAVNLALSLASGATSVASGVSSTVAAKERYRWIETQVAEMQAQAFHEVLLDATKRWTEDLQNFLDDLNAMLQQRSDWLSKEHELNVRLSAA